MLINKTLQAWPVQNRTHLKLQFEDAAQRSIVSTECATENKRTRESFLANMGGWVLWERLIAV